MEMYVWGTQCSCVVVVNVLEGQILYLYYYDV